MKIISLSVEEILPSLLDKSKTQTIRPAFINCETCYNKGVIDIGGEGELCYDCEGKSSWKEKPACFKVGEKAKLMWKQRSKYKIFCEKCGVGLEDGKNPNLTALMSSKNKCGCVADLLYKHLGDVKITEVKKVKMGYMNDENGKRVPFVDYEEGGFDNQSLAKRDGFKSVKEMFSLLDKKYDLSTPKVFWVYRWKWIK